MKFEVKNRFTGEVQFAAEIECADDAPVSVKLGLAVKWAVKTGANLAGANLAGANLADAYLARADLARADLAGAYLARADLAGANLAGANLAGADLARADLADAYLARADLAGANLARADLADADLARAYLARAKVKSLFAIIHRIADPYVFHAYETDQGVRIVAGCRNFSPEEYRAHVAESYADTPKGEETLAILDFIERRAAMIAAASEAGEGE